MDATDTPRIAAFEAWRAQWKDRLSHLSNDIGCGCCIHLYNVEGSEEALAALPRGLRISNGWSSGHGPRREPGQRSPA